MSGFCPLCGPVLAVDVNLEMNKDCKIYLFLFLHPIFLSPHFMYSLKLWFPKNTSVGNAVPSEVCVSAYWCQILDHFVAWKRERSIWVMAAEFNEWLFLSQIWLVFKVYWIFCWTLSLSPVTSASFPWLQPWSLCVSNCLNTCMRLLTSFSCFSPMFSLS